MFKKKKIKFYTHHDLAFAVGQSGLFKKVWIFFKNLGFIIAYGVGAGLVAAARALFVAAFLLCYNIGAAVIALARKSVSGLSNDARRTAASLRLRYHSLLAERFRQSLAAFVFLALLGAGIFAAARIIAQGLDLKSEVLRRALSGNSHLTEAQSALSQKDFGKAGVEFATAYQSFKSSQDDLANTNFFITQFIQLLPQARDAQNLLKAGELTSEAGQSLAQASSLLSNLKLSPQGLYSAQAAGENVRRAGELFQSGAAQLGSANDLFAAMDQGSLPDNLRLQFISARNKVGVLSSALNSSSQLFSVFEQLVLGRKRVLVLFENNNELRPAGGFIGTFGDFTLTDGAISNLRISSIYDLDGQLKQRVTPPTPMLAVNDRWFLRDSNWFADFAASSKKAVDFYEKEGNQTPDVVLALTPNIIVDLLKITGPVRLQAYGAVLDSDNFVEQTQVLGSISNNNPLNAPKQVFADFFPIFLQRLAQLPAAQYPQILLTLQQNLRAKQILLYSRDAQLESQLADYGWTGSVDPADRDYLQIVSANLGGTKTDLFIKKSIDLKSYVGKDGSVTDRLDIAITNSLPVMPDADNASFLRVLVPEGSQLISSLGFDYKNLDTKELKNSSVDPDVYAWEKSSVRDIVTGTLLGRESGKTFFGNWVTVAPGQTRTVSFSYKLPFALKATDHFSLLLQKQPGSMNETFNYNLDFSGYAMAYKNFQEGDVKGDTLTLQFPLSEDKFVGEVLEKR